MNQGRSTWSAMAVGLALLAPAGCGDLPEQTGFEWKGWDKGFARAPSGEQRIAATHSTHPDERREAIVWLSDPRRSSNENVVKLLAIMVRQDPDPTVRAAAARGLGRSTHPSAVEPLIAALEDENVFVRLDATRSLNWKVNDNVKRALLLRLAHDKDPWVRTAAAAGLDNYRERRVLESLIAALRDSDFAVVHRAEQSLIRLTGQTHHYDPDAWNRWLAGVGPEGDPFATAGQVPPSLRSFEQPWTDRMRQQMRDAWYWWQADEKPPD